MQPTRATADSQHAFLNYGQCITRDDSALISSLNAAAAAAEAAAAAA